MNFKTPERDYLSANQHLMHEITDVYYFSLVSTTDFPLERYVLIHNVESFGARTDILYIITKTLHSNCAQKL